MGSPTVAYDRKNLTQYVPLTVVAVAVVGAWFSLVGRVDAQDTVTKIHAKEDVVQTDRISAAERQLYELRTQTAVITTVQKQQAITMKEIKNDLKSILRAVRK